MFNDQEGGMLDYYDLTTERGRKGKKKHQKQTKNVINKNLQIDRNRNSREHNSKRLSS